MGNVTNLTAAKQAAKARQTGQANQTGPVVQGSAQGGQQRATASMAIGHNAASVVAQRSVVGALGGAQRASENAAVARTVSGAHAEQMAATNPAGGPA